MFAICKVLVAGVAVFQHGFVMLAGNFEVSGFRCFVKQSAFLTNIHAVSIPAGAVIFRLMQKQ